MRKFPEQKTGYSEQKTEHSEQKTGHAEQKAKQGAEASPLSEEIKTDPIPKETDTEVPKEMPASESPVSKSPVSGKENGSDTKSNNKQETSENPNTKKEAQNPSVSAQEEKTGKKKKKRKKRAWLRLFIKLLVVAALVYAASFFIKLYPVHNTGMFPSLRDGDLAIATNLMSISFNDIVLYQIEGEAGEPEWHLGRIMCLGGNTVEIDDYGNLIVNGSIITVNSFYQEFDKGNLPYPCTVEDDEVFLLQDYRPELDDSRTYGPIKRENIFGKIFYVFRVRNF